MSPEYLAANILAGQCWGLQVVNMIAGMLWSVSKANPFLYALRLMVFFVLGVFSNWLSYVAVGADWRSNMYDVVYQMWFVLGVALCVLFTGPLKSGLHHRGNTLWKATAGYGIFACAMISVATASSWSSALTYYFITYGGEGGRYYSKYADAMGTYLCLLSGCFAMTSLVCSLTLCHRREHSSEEPRA